MIEVNNKKLCDSCFAEVNGEGACEKCGFDKNTYSPDAMVLPIGTRLENKIIIGRVMGKGGFGVTYLGYDIRMEKVIAVKEYYPNGIAYRAPGGTEISVNDGKSAETFNDGAEKFYTEAEMVAQFNGNPNIVSVYDYFRANNTVYLIMEFISGMTLKNYVKRHGRLTDGQALFVMDKIAAALSITHSAGVLHRDISPDNIMICRDGKVKLIDFGAARQIMAESSSNLTVVMKPGYTPIEQYTKKGKQGAWTDIYSLGVSVYYALTEVILDDPYARMDSDDELAENSHNVNGDLWNILKKCTMINASDRYGSAIDLRKALKSVSAPLKAEAVVLNDDDLRDSPENAEEIPKTMEQTFPVTEKSEEPIEVFEDGDTAETVPADKAAEAVPADNTAADNTAADKTAANKKAANKKAADKTATDKTAADKTAQETVPDGEKPQSREIIPASEKPQGTPSYKKNKGKKLTAKRIFAAAAAAVGVIGIILAGMKLSGNDIFKKPIKSIVLDNFDAHWAENKTIPKSVLNEFNGDIKVTLDLQCFYRNCYHNLTVRDGNNDLLNVYAPNTGSHLGTYRLNDDQTKFVFIVKHADINKAYNELKFDVENLSVKGATVEDYDPDEYKINPKAKVIQLDSKKYPYSSPIPKEELESFNGDVKVTLSIERFEDSLKKITVDDKTLYWVSIYPYSGDTRIYTTTENVYRWENFSFELSTVNVPDKFTFIIPSSEISKLGSDGLVFQCSNVKIISAALEKA